MWMAGATGEVSASWAEADAETKAPANSAARRRRWAVMARLSFFEREAAEPPVAAHALSFAASVPTAAPGKGDVDALDAQQDALHSTQRAARAAACSTAPPPCCQVDGPHGIDAPMHRSRRRRRVRFTQRICPYPSSVARPLHWKGHHPFPFQRHRGVSVSRSSLRQEQQQAKLRFQPAPDRRRRLRADTDGRRARAVGGFRPPRPPARAPTPPTKPRRSTPSPCTAATASSACRTCPSRCRW